MRVNHHTHTFRCKHASGDVADYCVAAQTQGLDVLGFSDHTPLPDNFWPSVRMDMMELPAYNHALVLAQQAFPSLRVLKGMECEYDTQYTAFYREVLLDEYKFDYLAGGIHFFRYQGQRLDTFSQVTTPAHLRAYVDFFIAAMQSGLFSFMAHPDAFARNCTSWNPEIAACVVDLCTAAAELKVPLEINGYGLRKPPILSQEGYRPMYPWRPFWEIAAQMGVTAVVNSDAHRPQDVAANLDDGLALANELGIPVTTRILLWQ